MRLPTLDEVSTSRDMIQEFKGYNHNLRIGENEFDNMQNMCSDYYPVLSPRKKRGLLKTLTKPNGLFSKSNLFWVDGTHLFYNGAIVNGTNGQPVELQDNEKQFASMGGYLLIWPDKVYFNTADSTFGSLEQINEITGSIYYTLVTLDGNAYTYTSSPTEPDNPTDGQYWYNTTDNALSQYSTSSSAWVPVAATYVKIASPDIGLGFKKGDGIKIAGSSVLDNTDYIIQAVDEAYLIVTGIKTGEQTTGTLTISRTAPEMEFLAELDNRVWGCNSSKHEIYACKLGDPFNWYCYAGVSTDSYAVTVGTDGNFTGACAHLGYVLFFKEDCIHRIYGNKPANFTLDVLNVRGVEKGSEKSLAIVNETLFYKARNGICTYDGSLPSDISIPLGGVKYKNTVAGAVGNKYYASMADTSGTYHLFVYDQYTGLWHHEDNTQVLYFSMLEGELFYISGLNIMTVNGRLAVHDGGENYSGESAAESDFEWFAESGEIGMSLSDKKYVSKLSIRLKIGTPNPIKIAFQYDSSGIWEEHSSFVAQNICTIIVPVIPQRCDHLRVRISGKGDCKIYSITKTIEGGSEV